MKKEAGLYQLTELPNHTKVLTVSMEDRESAGVAIWVRVGGRYEDQRISGVSHFLEHMLFKGTGRRTSRQIKNEIEGVGGMLNAFTSEEATCYFAKLPAKDCRRAVDVLLDMVQNAALSTKEYDRERPVILEEIKMYRDLPSQYVHELMGELMWPEQPLGRSVAGSIESVSGLKREEMVQFKRRHYQPQNILVSVSGPVKHEEVLRMVRERAGQKRAGAASRFGAARNEQKKIRCQFVNKETEQTHFVVGFHGYSKKDPRRYALGVLNVLLGANMSSRLFEEVREKRGLAYEIKSGVSHYQDTGSVTISAGVENHKTQNALAVILRELEKLNEKKVPASELKRAKDFLRGQFVMGLEDTLDHLMWVGERVLYSQSLPDRKKILEKIQKVEPGDVRSAARDVFQKARLNLALTGPVKDEEEAQIRKTVESS